MIQERSTAQKKAILEAIRRAEAPLSVAEILARAQRTVATLSQATVYRVLKSLLQKGAIAAVQLPGAAPLYEPAGVSHHHFFRCRSCDRMHKVEGCADLLERLVPKGFTLEDHDVFLFGLCAKCRSVG